MDPREIAKGHKDATAFLEEACRNWAHVPKLTRDDIADVAQALAGYRAKAVAGLAPVVSQAPNWLAYIKQMREALEVVEGAMLRGGDGAIGDFGWSITALNKARPLVRAALLEMRDE